MLLKFIHVIIAKLTAMNVAFYNVKIQMLVQWRNYDKTGGDDA